MKCRFCQTELSHVFADLGTAPPSNSFLTKGQLNAPEVYYPLKAWVCEQCFLVQIDEFKKSTEIFSNDYVYFSSVSKSWLEHSEKYVEMITRRLSLDQESFVIEIAANDGYLLRFVLAKRIPCLGIEPTASTAAVAKSRGIPMREDFFGTALARQLAAEGKQADLLLGNNVLAHVPDINDFVAGLKIVLKPAGTVTMEFPHLLRLIVENQFDTIYHEHFSYLSCFTADAIFRRQGLEIYDVEEPATHGGSLRIYAKHAENERITVTENVNRLLDQEKREGIRSLSRYEGFGLKMEKIRADFLRFLLQCKAEGKMVAAYGAAAKGNTLLNYCGVTAGMIGFVCDRAESKLGKFLPGSRIPVVPEDALKEHKPDFVVIFPWNIRDEVEKQLDYVRQWGGRFVTVIPKLAVKP